MSILNNSEAELAAIKEVNKHLHDQVKELRTESNELSKQNKALVNHNFALRTENEGLCAEIKILHAALVKPQTKYEDTVLKYDEATNRVLELSNIKTV